MDQVTLDAIDWCILHGIPFAAYRFPHSEDVEFWSSPSAISDTRKISQGFFISEFNTPFSKCHWIAKELDADGLLRARNNLKCDYGYSQSIVNPATGKDAYISSLDTLVTDLKARGNHKTVISIVKEKSLTDSNIAVFEMADNLFRGDNNTFRNCFYHPSVGLWMGATPELLLECDIKERSFSTMALAGTVTSDEGLQWDDKNRREHEFVVDYISEALCSLGIMAQREPLSEVQFGKIKHLCTRFQGSMHNVSPEEIVDALNPTPALCGTPKDVALSDIAAIERHSRKCYGGYIGVSEADRFSAYVNIRCMEICGDKAWIYGGGGITGDSDPGAEWREAENKINATYDIMTKSQIDKIID